MRATSCRTRECSSLVEGFRGCSDKPNATLALLPPGEGFLRGGIVGDRSKGTLAPRGHSGSDAYRSVADGRPGSPFCGPRPERGRLGAVKTSPCMPVFWLARLPASSLSAKT